MNTLVELRKLIATKSKIEKGTVVDFYKNRPVVLLESGVKRRVWDSVSKNEEVFIQDNHIIGKVIQEETYNVSID